MYDTLSNLEGEACDGESKRLMSGESLIFVVVFVLDDDGSIFRFALRIVSFLSAPTVLYSS
jgi:hypothetical protein